MARREGFLEKGASSHFRNMDQDTGIHYPFKNWSDHYLAPWMGRRVHHSSYGGLPGYLIQG